MPVNKLNLTTLDKCVTFLSGGTPDRSNSDYWSGEIPWVSSGEMTERRLYDTTQHITISAAESKSRIIPAGTVLVVVRGMSLATEFRVSITQKEMAFNQDIKALICNENINSEFLYYYLTAQQSHIKDLATEASHGTKKLELDVLCSYKIPLFSLSTQRNIVDIIARYDDLIENNRRRMAKLEEAARLLYQEWFVRLQFPGHDHTRIVNGLPVRWSKPTLQAVCVPDNGIQTGPFGSQLHQSDYTETGVPVVMPKDIIEFRIVTDSIARIPEELANSLGRHRLQEGDVVYGRRGDIGRRAFISSRQVGWFCGTGCLRLRPNSAIIDPRYFFDALGSPETAGAIAGRAKGATMPNLNAGIMADVTILTPSYALQKEYAKHVTELSDMIECLSTQNEKLRAARDLLLPRLMSGEIAV